MNILDEELAILTELDNLRREARQLRQLGKQSLKRIKDNSRKKSPGWDASEDLVEAALLVKIQAHRHLGGEANDAEVSAPLLKKLLATELERDLFAGELDEEDDQSMAATVPILAAARIMQSLVTTSKNAFKRASLICYYRIVREIQSADSPNWIVGGAKAGKGGGPTAFITGECIRAILSFARTHSDTALFFRYTAKLSEQIENLKKLDKTHPSEIQKWQEAEIERVGLAWFTSTEVRLGEIALNMDRQPPGERITRDYLEAYLRSLRGNLITKIGEAKKEFESALGEVQKHRDREEALAAKGGDESLRMKRLDRSASAHRLAKSVVIQAIDAADTALALCAKHSFSHKNLEELSKVFDRIADRIYKVAEPAKRFAEAVLNRELAAASADTTMDWDARELVFAAAAYGAANRWTANERLTEACKRLLKAISQKGTFPAGQPFLLLPNGFVLNPTAFEVTRCFAQLLQRVNVSVDPELVKRLLYHFRTNKPRDLPNDADSKQRDQSDPWGWRFEDPMGTRPSLWVTATAVMALNRIVRMLNEKINSGVFRYFSVKIPGKSLTGPMLEELVYPDYGLALAGESAGKKWENSIAIALEQMRGHLLGTSLPDYYGRNPLYSVLFYGPPGTGKTTLLEALAFSSNVPLVEISPSDIVVSGQELVESRTRAVFEVLSMLNRVVIALDEFEPILYQRKKTKKATSIFTFVTPAMLPKLRKLHDAARQQSIVYCLVTNHRDKLDEAAIRKGRFDYHIGIYDMDPLSRAGLFLHKILTQNQSKIGKLKSEQYSRFEEVIKLLAVVSIDEVAKEWLRVPVKPEDAPESPYAYIVDGSAAFKAGINYRRALVAYTEKYQNYDASKVDDPVRIWLDKLEVDLKATNLEKVLKRLC